MKQNGNKQIVIISTHTIFHPFLDVSVIKMLRTNQDLFATEKPLQSLKQQPIFISEEDHDYILDKIMRSDHIEYKKKINNDKISDL